jgi:hypothetical protein
LPPFHATPAPRADSDANKAGEVREWACKAPTKLGPEQDVLGGGSGDVLQVQIGSHFKEQFGRRFSRQKRGLFRLQKREPNLPPIQPLISPQIHPLGTSTSGSVEI